ncbi:hypothetical protein HFO61_07850 [Rhizobium leguminosarum]|uniref:hypothetical protein n=1 Tax=Rhizobium leguminosarum TaxID=384 RepID=UPI001A910D8F|nr:hypothetical protein [Rhizobium leguminosarum]MBY5412938.1 hypothetical protein [Rhizobium leguminosarum]MBY5546743.1 hypothetical protein [Rhizobium leguminosarum]MBY5558138.1 hypothetical protein [Rhizobium leguminosarum]QSW27851.1 hypothetical protein J0664_32395 [Rhizobium leguminosarum]
MEDIKDDIDATQAKDGSGTQASTSVNQHGRTSKDGKKAFGNLTVIRFTQGASQILLPVSYTLTTRARLPIKEI